MPLSCHGNKFPFWYFNATSDIQIYGIFTEFTHNYFENLIKDNKNDFNILF